MASLDVLDYQVGLEEALAAPGPDGQPVLAAGLRRQAVKDARRAIESMAFRFALMDERPLPEDIDYVRALEAIKSPDAVAAVLARRSPFYTRVRRRRLITTWTTLAIIGLLIGGLAYLATIEVADEVANINERAPAGASFNRTFVVDETVTRLHLDGTIVVPKGQFGAVEIFLVDPDGVSRVYESFPPGGNNYLRENVERPQPGTWTLLVDYGSDASVLVTVDAIRPAR